MENTQNKKTELVNDLMAISTIMEDYWRFHPANEKQENVVEEYAKLKTISEHIEEELKTLEE